MSPKQQRASLASLQSPAPAEAPPMPAHRVEEPPRADPHGPEIRSPEVQSPEVREPRSRRRAAGPRVTEKRTPVARTPEVQTPGLPKYLRLERKELLIWPDQITELSILARVVNRNRHGAGERITQNTLIRVAVTLLLSRARELAGTTEEELRQSLGLAE